MISKKKDSQNNARSLLEAVLQLASPPSLTVFFTLKIQMWSNFPSNKSDLNKINTVNSHSSFMYIEMIC